MTLYQKNLMPQLLTVVIVVRQTRFWNKQIVNWSKNRQSHRKRGRYGTNFYLTLGFFSFLTKIFSYYYTTSLNREVFLG